MVLVDNQILDRIRGCSKPLIEPFDNNRLQTASYDVSVSDMVQVYKNEVGEIDLKSDEKLENKFTEIKISKSGYYIKPGEYLLVKLNETINMPDDLMAIIVPRTTMNRMGIDLKTQYVNPSYSGKMFLALKNNAPIPIKIYNNTVIGQICFFELQGKPDEDNLYRNKGNKSYQNEDDFRIVPDRVKSIVESTLQKMVEDK